MALTPRLDQRQTQALVMTPQLQQAIKLLQMSNLELSEYVAEELERNPLLEAEDAERGGSESAAVEPAGAETADTDAPGAGGDPSPERVATDEAPPEMAAQALDIDYNNDWQDAAGAGRGDETGGPSLPGFSGSGRGRGLEGDRPSAEDSLTRDVTLREHLLAQLGIDISDPQDRLIGTHLIDMLDEAGYLAGGLESVAERLGCDAARVQATLERLQQFDPAGVFARDLAECLALQLRERDRLDPAMQTLLGHLDLIARRDLSALTRLCGVDAEDIADMLGEIRALNPKPGLVFDPAPAEPVIPDVLMRPQPGGGWIVELNPDTLPRVLINNAYHARVSRAARTKEERHYIAEQIQSANWLVKSLHQRATTILKVAAEIVRQQERFFARGVAHLKPLVLRDIATAIEMHESTVSRVTSNKFIATPRGIYELKYFFSTALPAAGGGAAHSAESVRHRIRALIEGERADAVLSDDQIVDILKGEGIEVARRTVAKYREGLGIASSVQRRREKNSAWPGRSGRAGAPV
ncbi:MAG: RNA polymerase factor sigma-54 [Rhodospirillales bacterium]|nr:RNA polymerase factor sigma-54 [Rhodospirillales bacterium]